MWRSLALLALGYACAGDPSRPEEADTKLTTILRFAHDSTLEVPEASVLSVQFWDSDSRQHEDPRQLGPVEYEPDTKLIVQGSALSDRFTVFAELLSPTQERISWVRVRSGFVSGPLHEVSISFSVDCPIPIDQLSQPSNFETKAACGSHDTCSFGECSRSCYTPRPFTAETLPVPQSPGMCPDSDCARVQSVHAGWGSTCARFDDEAFCWGSLDWNNTENAFARPSRVINEEGRARLGKEDAVQSLSLSAVHGCLVTESGALRCGGKSPNGQLAGAPESKPCCDALPTPSQTDNTEVVVRAGYTCVRRANEVFCAGRVPGSTGDRPSFERLEGLPNAEQLFGLRVSLCGWWQDRLVCTGGIVDGDLGLVRAQTKHVTANTLTLCAVAADGVARCWGRGVDKTDYPAQPSLLSGRWKKLALPGYPFFESNAQPHRCGIADSGGLFCWGANLPAGRLGQPTSVSNTPEDAPLRVGDTQDWTDVAVGAVHTCAIRSDSLFCWGDNARHQLGIEGPGGATPQKVCVPRW